MHISPLFNACSRCCRNLAAAGLTGTLPADSAVWEPLNTLQTIDLAQNQLSGAVRSLQRLVLASNLLQGTLPSWAAIQALQQINLANNRLTGAFLCTAVS